MRKVRIARNVLASDAQRYTHTLGTFYLARCFRLFETEKDWGGLEGLGGLESRWRGVHVATFEVRVVLALSNSLSALSASAP